MGHHHRHKKPNPILQAIISQAIEKIKQAQTPAEIASILNDMVPLIPPKYDKFKIKILKIILVLSNSPYSPFDVPSPDTRAIFSSKSPEMMLIIINILLVVL